MAKIFILLEPACWLIVCYLYVNCMLMYVIFIFLIRVTFCYLLFTFTKNKNLNPIFFVQFIFIIINLIIFTLVSIFWNSLMMILGNGNDFRRRHNRSWESYCSLDYFDVKIILLLVNTLITKFDDVISNRFLFKIYY